MWSLDVENIAGIRSGEADVHPELNVIQAENWQGKSSFMTALQVVMGTTGIDGVDHPLTDTAGEGQVRLDTDTATYETTLVRDETGISRRGDTYITDEQDRLCAHLFAFLGEDNPVRRTVRNDGDLAEQLTRPLELENIDEQISELKRERTEVETELERAEDAAQKLPDTQREITRLETELEELRDKRDEIEAERSDTSDGASRDELSDAQARTEQLESQITTLTNKIERREATLQERRRELEALEVPDDPEFTADVEDHQARVSELETRINLLEDLYRVNKRIIDEDRADLVTDIERTLTGDEIDCWVCGETTSADRVEERLTQITDAVEDYRSERDELQAEIEEIEERRAEIRRRKRRQRELESEISDLEIDLEENRSELAGLEEQLAESTERLEQLREEVEESDAELTNIESEIKYKQTELEEKRAEKADLDAAADRRDTLNAEHEELTAEIRSLRARRENKKRELAERFDSALGDIIEIFDPGFETARLTPKTNPEGEITDFELVIARDGQETSLDALSEGEVELLGIVTALAGYETFDVADRVPVVLLDGLTALSGSNFAALAEYLRDKPEYLVTTAYPEVEEFDGHTIDPNEWDVVSNRRSPTP